MWAKPVFQTPPALIVLALLLFLGVLLGREASTTEDLPVFLPLERGVVYVELSGDGMVSGEYQFSDGSTILDVIKLTEPLPAEIFTTDPAWSRPLQNGESLRIVRKDHKIMILQQGWMTASHRIALAIPLHPDRMSREDWKALPGIGDVLAERIENDRQKSGDYGRLKDLTRVKGIGEKRINSWEYFFDEV